MSNNLIPWTHVVTWLLVVSGLYAAFVIGAMTLGTLVFLEAAVLMLGLIALALRTRSRPIHSIRQILHEVERPVR